ncbi:MAG: dephospho-CoA kinase [Coriobacteriia bacterium]|nr:dephospho-CoA kinase [Coriobacteriia bacterium]MBN2839734.1 dephospho-CoA kinase [Coriobacteriia bacterium]
MYVLALTGGIGSGKSTAAEVFADRGAVVIDLDTIGHVLLEQAAVVQDRVVAAFGEQIVGADGRIDRTALAAAAFASEEATQQLNAIMHPAILATVAGALDTLALQGEQPQAVVLVIPLLVESPLFLEPVDAVLTISAHEETRIERAIARGMSREDTENRIARQAGDGERREIADYVIENDGDLDEFRAAIAAFWDTEIAPREV